MAWRRLAVVARPDPGAVQRVLGHCTHGAAQVERYFLPWHRIYIYFYEVIVRGHVKDLGGPDDWALPYWNYSYQDPDNPSPPWPRARLPYLENITGADAGNYLVYLNNTKVDRNTADQVPHFVGAFTAFGADHHEGHEGHGGMSASYDITDLVAYLRSQGEWDEAGVNVTIVPAAPEGFDLVTGPVNVGQISIRTS